MRIGEVLTMAEYVTKERVIDWYRPYGQTDEPIPFETLVSDLRDMKAADVVPVRKGRWESDGLSSLKCSDCGYLDDMKMYHRYCPDCGCFMR